MHLIYTRFFTMMMRDAELVGQTEPMAALKNQGMVLGEDNEKMSKSRGNVVAPDDLVQQYGSDTVRAYLMFFTRWEQGGPWSFEGIKGPRRFIEDVWRIGTAEYASQNDKNDTAVQRKLHQTIEKVTRDAESFSFNTAIAAMMELRNTLLTALKKQDVTDETWSDSVSALLRMLAPIAPHITEELWSVRGSDSSVHVASWPEFDPEIAKEDEIELVIQVNGKVRSKVMVAAGIDDDSAREIALADENVQKFMDGKEVRKVIVIKGRLVNIVV